MEIQIVTITGLLFLLMASLIFHWRQFGHSERKATEISRLTRENLMLGDDKISLEADIIKLKAIILDKPKKQDSRELQEFLSDLFQGSGLVRVERVDPSSIFLHSPKGYQN